MPRIAVSVRGSGEAWGTSVAWVAWAGAASTRVAAASRAASAGSVSSGSEGCCAFAVCAPDSSAVPSGCHAGACAPVGEMTSSKEAGSAEGIGPRRALGSSGLASREAAMIAADGLGASRATRPFVRRIARSEAAATSA